MPYFFYLIDDSIPICRLLLYLLSVLILVTQVATYFSGHSLMKEPAKTISVSRYKFGGIFFLHRCEVGGRNIYPAKPTSTLSYCFFLISVSRCRFGTKKPRKTHIYSFLLQREFNLIFHTQLIDF